MTILASEVKCPHCGNEDKRMITELPGNKDRHYKWDVLHNKILRYFCEVCSKEF